MVYFKRFFIFLFLTILIYEDAEGEDFSSGAEYLQTAIRDIVMKNSERSVINLIDNQPRVVTASRRIVTSSPSPVFDVNRRFSGGEHHQPTNFHDEYIPADAHPSHTHPSPHSPHSHNIPDPPALTKGELAALYEAAIAGGHSVQMNIPGHHEHHGHDDHDSTPVQAVMHEVHDNAGYQHHQNHIGDATDGYYYYYYPLKSFLDGIPAHVPKPTHQVHKEHYKAPVLTSYNTHMHNIKVEPIHTVTDPPGKGGKALEPLFMAISSFVGMAVMFVFSMVFWPRLSSGLKGGIKGVFTGSKPKAKHNINNKNNNNKNKKKPRLFPNTSWPNIIADFISAYGCKNCASHASLAPYKNALRRMIHERARSKTQSH